MKNNLSSLWAAVLSIAAAVSVHAQTTAFNYQGQLNDGANPASGIYDLRFTIYDAASGGGIQAGPLTNATTSVSNGLFTVALNFGASPFTGADRWLEIGVRTNGSPDAYQALTPRQQLTATPYAIRAANFSGAVAASQLTGTISPNNIGAGSITGTMLASGAVGANQLASGAVTTSALADGTVTASKIATVGASLLTTITSPSPQGQDDFGRSIAALGSDRLVIGAPYFGMGMFGPNQQGAAFLFGINGAPLATFNNPNASFGDHFGISVAALGTDRVIIGAERQEAGSVQAGAVYLFNTNGTLLTTITNPTPADLDYFGKVVAAVGTDRVLVGAYQDDTRGTDAGAAYLFSTNGTLLTTFTNSSPAAGDYFGYALAAVGNDRVLIGAYQRDTVAGNVGVAYLFNVNGTLLTTFNSPNSAANESFGYAVAAVGTDRVLISAVGDNTGAGSAGAAYLFSTNGTLLATFNNPTPANNEEFGFALAVLGNGRLLISGNWNTGGEAAYLFNTNGSLLTTYFNPAPSLSTSFGASLAGIPGTDRAVIAAENGFFTGGRVYLFGSDPYMPGVIADAVRTGSITTTNLADGAVTSAKISGTLLDGQLSANVAFLNATQNFTGQNNFNTNVGIGTTSPLTALHVRGNGDTEVSIESAQAARRWTIQSSGASLPDVRGSLQIIDRTAGSSRLIIQPNGNVGIGTATPSALLTVNGAISSGSITSSSITSVSIASGSITSSFVGNGSGLTSLNASQITSGTLPVAQLPAYAALLTATNQTFSGQNGFLGNVGIGNNNPSTRLHVTSTGDTEISIQSQDANSRRWTLQSSGAGSAGLEGSFQIIDRTAGASRLIIDTAGKAGINTNNLFVTGVGGENLRIVRGTVNADGSIVSGTGFSVNKTGTGMYTITFTTAFQDTPAVTATAVTDGVTSLDSLAAGSFGCGVHGGSIVGGNRADRQFSFIAIGSR